MCNLHKNCIADFLTLSFFTILVNQQMTKFVFFFSGISHSLSDMSR